MKHDDLLIYPPPDHMKSVICRVSRLSSAWTIEINDMVILVVSVNYPTFLAKDCKCADVRVCLSMCLTLYITEWCECVQCTLLMCKSSFLKIKRIQPIFAGLNIQKDAANEVWTSSTHILRSVHVINLHRIYVTFFFSSLNVDFHSLILHKIFMEKKKKKWHTFN